MLAHEIPAKRSGAGHWARSFATMLRWEIVRMRLVLPITALVQAVTGAGLILGLGLFFGDISSVSILYLATGAVVITLVTVGLVLGPQLIAQLRLSGSWDFLAALPVPRSAATAAWVGLTTIVAIPGMLTALLAAWLRYDAQLQPSPLIVPAVALVLLSGTLVGYAYGHAIPRPRLVNLVSQVLIFVTLGFSPISFPAENLPGWLADAHQYLPFVHMGNVVRAGLTEGLATDVGRSFAILSAWTIGAGVVASVAIGRRG
jgi:ABC-2 type transport system permease protein